jgi:2-iminobutanoate/2-iminopropanoate deaminase
MKRALALLLFLALAAGMAAAGDAKPHQFVNIAGHFQDLPFSDAVLAGDTLYISGRIGLDLKTRKPPAEIEDEVRLMMQAVETTLAQAGMTWDDVVNVTIYCPDLTLYPRFNAVYQTYFHNEHYPARAFIGSGPLLFGGHFEMTTIAVRSRPAGKKK